LLFSQTFSRPFFRRNLPWQVRKRLDLPQVDLVNFRVEFVRICFWGSERRSRERSSGGYRINKTKDFSESLEKDVPIQLRMTETANCDLQSVGSAWLCNQRFLLNLREKCPEKVISLTIQANINLYIFRVEFVVKKKLFLTSAGFLNFSRESVGWECV